MCRGLGPFEQHFVPIEQVVTVFVLWKMVPKVIRPGKIRVDLKNNLTKR